MKNALLSSSIPHMIIHTFNLTQIVPSAKVAYSLFEDKSRSSAIYLFKVSSANPSSM